jgi:hypothetical protein
MAIIRPLSARMAGWKLRGAVSKGRVYYIIVLLLYRRDPTVNQGTMVDNHTISPFFILVLATNQQFAVVVLFWNVYWLEQVHSSDT